MIALLMQYYCINNRILIIDSVMSEFQRAIQVLRASGYKVTQPRKQVLRVLEEAQEPVSPYDIQDILEER